MKTTESGGVTGYDAGKRIKGRKRHIVTDTPGLLVGLVVHSAGIQDRDGAPDVLKAVAVRFPMLRHIFADGGYAGPKLRDALKAIGRWTVETVKRSDAAGGFEVLPRRWVVEPTFSERRDHQAEILEAQYYWDFELAQSDNRLEDSFVVLKISTLKPR